MLSTKKSTLCQVCGAYIAKSAQICPNCGCQVKKGISTGRIILICICFILGIILFTSGILTILGINPIGDTNDNTVFSDTTISMSEFNQIKTGMTYSEVVEIVGVNGELMSEVDIGYSEYATKVYTWEGNGYTGSNANVTFQGGKVVSKAQIGLK